MLHGKHGYDTGNQGSDVKNDGEIKMHIKPKIAEEKN